VDETLERPAARGLDGLTEQEVRDRLARGLVNDVPAAPSRTVRDILRANILTRFNALLGSLLVLILIVGPIQDALFGLVIISNAAIGIIEELRAKRKLDELIVLTTPKARIVRDGEVRESSIDQVVLDDVLELRPGDQVVVDGVVLKGQGLEVDESLLTGESDPVVREAGAEVRSGSFVVAGRGRYRATRVGPDAYAASLAQEAKRFTLVHSELRSGIDLILRVVTWLIVPTATLLFISQLGAQPGIRAALRSSVGGVVHMVPEGLVLLTSIAFAVGFVRLARRRVLVQELPAIEVLARVDVLCIDKTGTLTEGRISVEEVQRLDGAGDPHEALAALAALDPDPNATMAAIAERFPPTGPPPAASVTAPFSSARKWSGATLLGGRTWILGAPEVVLGSVDQRRAEEIVRASEGHAAAGRRVVLLARSDAALDGAWLPAELEPVALVILGDRVKDDAAETLRFFAEQGVEVKVISGDHPRTVGAIAAEVGATASPEAFDARQLPEEQSALAHVLEEESVFGRVTPHQKRAMVGALQAQGRTVAMTGDGVNDVLALKDADIGIAMGTGSTASRSVSQLVLLDARFRALPSVVAEGRRVLGNIERTANLFLTKTVYAMLLAIVIGVAQFPFPFLPRHLTIISSLTIGIPGFFLALAPNARRARPGFVPRVLRFAVPAGVVAAAATFTAHYLAQEQARIPTAQVRTTATLVLLLVGLAVLVRIATPLNHRRRLLVGAMLGGFLLIALTPPLAGFFALDLPPALVVFSGLGVVAVAVLLLRLVLPRSEAGGPPVQ